MIRPKRNDEPIQLTKQDLMKILTEDDAMKILLQKLLQEVLEAEMETALQAGKNERTRGRLGYRSGHYPRTLVTRVGKLELKVPQDRQGRFSTELFERYQRSEKALVAALMQMYVQGVSTRRVKTITEELCGHEFSASAISELNVKMDEELRRFMHAGWMRRIRISSLMRVTNGSGKTASAKAERCLITLGIGWDGRRHVLSVELAGRESASSWKAHLLRLKERGLHGVQLAVSDDHAGLKRAIMEALPEAYWQRCYVHFLRNALDYLPRKQADDCLVELRWIYDRHDAEEARRDLAAWLARWQDKHPKLCAWVEANIDETFAFYRLPRAHHKHLKSTNLLERLNQEIKRRTLLVRIFPDEASCLRLVQALAVETHEEWVDENRYLNMDLLREHLKRPASARKLPNRHDRLPATLRSIHEREVASPPPLNPPHKSFYLTKPSYHRSTFAELDGHNY
jgi:putative transposase